MTTRDREADLIGHVRTHETCTPECDDFRRLLVKTDGPALGNLRWMDGHQLGVKDGQAEVREAVEAVCERRVRDDADDDGWIEVAAVRDAVTTRPCPPNCERDHAPCTRQRWSEAAP